jgi:hypothetical protein
MVHIVQATSDNQLSLNLRYTGNGISAAISLIATALKTTPGMEQTLGANASSSGPLGSRVVDSNVTNSGWICPATMPIKVQGGISLYDADLIIGMVVPSVLCFPH